MRAIMLLNVLQSIVLILVVKRAEATRCATKRNQLSLDECQTILINRFCDDAAHLCKSPFFLIRTTGKIRGSRQGINILFAIADGDPVIVLSTHPANCVTSVNTETN